MNNVHPSETGGSGKFLRRFSTPKKGDVKEDKIYCAQCGLPFRLDSDAHGDSQDSPGIVVEDLVVSIANVQSNLPIHLQGLTAFSDTSRTIKEPTVVGGCRLCGTYNPKGKESRVFDTSHKDMSGL